MDTPAADSLAGQTPADAGYYMPPEWAPHARCWMAWPCRKSLWGEHLEAACDAYAEVAEAISDFEPVTMIARGDEVASVSMRTGQKVATLPLPHDDSWLRDNGPSFLVDGKGGAAGVSWIFNGWGGKYQPIEQDAAVAGSLLDRLRLRRFQAPLVLEGGAFHVDGEGTLITTEQCLLNPNRNPTLGREEIEALLKAYLGVTTVIWLVGDPLDDETDGHVDNLACFAAPGRVLALHPGAPEAVNYPALTENLRRLREARDARGAALEVIEVPQPQRMGKDYHGRPMLGSYINFYVANGGIVMPVFEDAMDQKAMDLIGQAYPGRKVIAVPGLDIAYGGGGIHCITQQQPATEPRA